ncbi:hypothetical protein [uncultured Cyclobacterium sp.]|uniref:hypothetical protein n=1 Tax=uncultured Cyclobacterium sp. TaxID=453820 RepID=UPI0030EB6133|tara:strand:- start:68337 stop:69281 length:945 start_codon:yes stop_codon:yes gene_type:complete
MTRKIFFIAFFFIAISNQIFAQGFNRYAREKAWSFSLQGGPSQYFGDLYALWEYKEGVQPDYNVGLSARYTFGTNLKARGDIGFYQISGQDDHADPESGRIPRNLNFRSRNFEAALMVEYYLYPVKVYYVSREFYNPYVFFGIGATTNNPQTLYNGEWVNLRPLRTENEYYNEIVTVFPMGLGFKYKANVYMDFFIEGSYRFTYSDHLDDVSAFNISGFYEELIEDYITGLNPDRLRFSIREDRFLLPNGEPNVELIRNTKGSARRGSGDPRINEPGARYDGYFTLNFGAEIYFSLDIWDNWIFSKRNRGFKFR